MRQTMIVPKKCGGIYRFTTIWITPRESKRVVKKLLELAYRVPALQTRPKEAAATNAGLVASNYSTFGAVDTTTELIESTMAGKESIA